jgi:ATP-dependent DNA helicase 2 subunit 2
VDDCEGIFGTLQQAVEELGIPRLKLTRPVSSYKGYLTLGHPELYSETACRIDVDRYPRTMIRRPPSASKFVQRSETSKEQDSNQSSNTILPETGDPHSASTHIHDNDLTSVRNSRTYQVIDEGAPGGKRDVDRDDLARGYEYGRTAVHISESDENVTKLETQAGLEILGFIPWSSVRLINPNSMVVSLLTLSTV